MKDGTRRNGQIFAAIWAKVRSSLSSFFVGIFYLFALVILVLPVLMMTTNLLSNTLKALQTGTISEKGITVLTWTLPLAIWFLPRFQERFANTWIEWVFVALFWSWLILAIYGLDMLVGLGSGGSGVGLDAIRFDLSSETRVMPHLPQADLREHRKWLEEWRVPTEMYDYVERVADYMGAASFLGQSGTTFLRDAWLAGKFGTILKRDAVRLIDESQQWPDFEARQGDNLEQVECVEALLPNRRRSDEYREMERRKNLGESIGDADPIENWIARAEQIPCALQKAVRSKLKKQYSDNSRSLLIYLNIDEWGIRRKEILQKMPAALASAKGSFSRIWVLWQDEIFEPCALNNRSPVP